MQKKEEIAIELINVNKTFHLEKNILHRFKNKISSIKDQKEQTINAVKNINLTINKGDVVGFIGNNGSGKSTLTKLMSGAYIPDKGGKVKRHGTSLLMNLGVGFSHELSARENIYVSGSTLGLRLKEIDAIFDQIIAFAELEEFVDTKIKYFSSGMTQRLAFSVAINAQADIMFLDEVFAVGDKTFRQKATSVLEKNWMVGRTVVLVSHGMQMVKKYCNKAGVMHKGELIFFGAPQEAIDIYQNL